MAESPNLLGERAQRADEHDFRYIFVLSSEAYRNAAPWLYAGVRVWSVAEDIRASYNGSTWDTATEEWTAEKSRFVWIQEDSLSSTKDAGSAYYFLNTTKGFVGVTLQTVSVTEI